MALQATPVYVAYFRVYFKRVLRNGSGAVVVGRA
jgi:hypothetical protein